MSKGGGFAHFGSREDLQLAILQSAAARFGDAVLVPALSQPRGLPRLRAIMRHWFDFVHRNDGSCVLLGSVIERSEEHTSELQSLMRISYAVFCLKKKKKKQKNNTDYNNEQ